MTAIGVSRGVGVVLEQEHLTTNPVIAQSGLRVVDEASEDSLPSLIVRHEVDEGIALRCCVLRVTADV